MFRVLARNIHPIVVILGPVSDAEVADPDARGCPPTNTRVDKRRLGWLVSQGQARGRYYVAGPTMRPVIDTVQQARQPYTDLYRQSA
jgi:hypothetical protein